MNVGGAPGSVAADAATGVAIGIATVMALHQRQSTNKGTHVDLSQGENFVPHLGEVFLDYELTVGLQDLRAIEISGWCR